MVSAFFRKGLEKPSPTVEYPLAEQSRPSLGGMLLCAGDITLCCSGMATTSEIVTIIETSRSSLLRALIAWPGLLQQKSFNVRLGSDPP